MIKLKWNFLILHILSKLTIKVIQKREKEGSKLAFRSQKTQGKNGYKFLVNFKENPIGSKVIDCQN